MFNRRLERIAACSIALLAGFGNVATAAQSGTSHTPEAVISIPADGQYLFDGAKVQRAELPQRIYDALEDVPVRLQVIDLIVGPTVPYGTVMDALAICRDVGFIEVRLGIRHDGESDADSSVAAMIGWAVMGTKQPLTSGLPRPVSRKPAWTGPPPAPPPSPPPPPARAPASVLVERMSPGVVPDDPDALFVTVNGVGTDRTVAINGRELPLAELRLLLSGLIPKRDNWMKFVSVKFEKGSPSGEVLDIVREMHQAGARPVVLIIDDVPGPTGIAQLDREPPEVPEAPPTAPAAPKFIRVSGGVLAGKAVKRPQPEYPDEAREIGIQGTVVVEVTVSETGRVITARAISGHPLLRDAAVAAARGWTFNPIVVQRKALKVIGTITFSFRKR